MRREQLEHAIRTACQVIGGTEVIVVGSQAILGTFREDVLPAEATMSIEVDILPIADDNEKTARLADLIEGVAGEFSSFEELHGFSIDGVDLETSILPEGWRDRLDTHFDPSEQTRSVPVECSGGCSGPAWLSFIACTLRRPRVMGRIASWRRGDWVRERPGTRRRREARSRDRG